MTGRSRRCWARLAWATIDASPEFVHRLRPFVDDRRLPGFLRRGCVFSACISLSIGESFCLLSPSTAHGSPYATTIRVVDFRAGWRLAFLPAAEWKTIARFRRAQTMHGSFSCLGGSVRGRLWLFVRAACSARRRLSSAWNNMEREVLFVSFAH